MAGLRISVAIVGVVMTHENDRMDASSAERHCMRTSNSTRNSAEYGRGGVASDLRDILVSAHGMFPAKRAIGNVRIPRALTALTERHAADAGPGLLPIATCWPSCPACRAVGSPAAERPTSLRLDDVRAGLARGRGVPLKVLLTIYRWARVYAQTPTGRGAKGEWFNETAELRLAELAVQCLPHASLDTFDDQSPPVRVIRHSIAALKSYGLIEVVGNPGGPSFYVPHAVGEFSLIPQGLWAQGWVSELSGGALMLLLTLMARTSANVMTMRLDAPLQELTSAFAVTTRGQRDALSELEERRLVTEVRTQKRTVLVALDPELMHPAPVVPSRLRHADLREFARED